MKREPLTMSAPHRRRRLTPAPTALLAARLAALLMAALLTGLAPAGLHAQAGGDTPSFEEGFNAPLPGQQTAPGENTPKEAPDSFEQGFNAPLPGQSGPGDAGGQEPGGFEQGFDAPLPGQQAGEDAGTAGTDAPPETPARWRVGGFVRFDGAYNYAHEAPTNPGQTDFRGLSKLRLALRLELSIELGADWDAFISAQAFRDFAYQINGEEQYTPQVLDAYQEEGELREAYVLGTPAASLDVKLGRQVVVWGKSDNIRIVDILNPLDFREPGLTDLEDLRLPLTMTRLDYYSGDWSLTGIAIHEVRFNKDPVPGSDFFPFGELPPERVPEDGGSNTEWAASLGGIFSGWDLAFYWAEVFNDDAHAADADDDPGNGIQPERRHARIHMAGAAVNVAVGNWLLKSEAARFSGLRFANRPDRTFERIDALLGAEWTGITDTTLALELADRRLLDHDAALAAPPDAQREEVNQYVLSYRGTYLRETLDLVAVISAFGAKAEQGTLQRYQLTYELATALDGTLGVLIFTPGDGENFILNAAQDNDRVFFELKWSF